VIPEGGYNKAKNVSSFGAINYANFGSNEKPGGERLIKAVSL
jgi:hypothetical protein